MSDSGDDSTMPCREDLFSGPRSERFSDKKLYQFQDEFRLHVLRCEERFDEGNTQLARLICAQQKNTDEITTLVMETHAVVQLHKDIQVVTRVGRGAHAFMKWVVAWPLVVAGIYATMKWIALHLP